MLSIDKDTGTMIIVAKDTADYIFSMTNYILDEGDEVVFTINREVEIEEPLVQKKYTEFINGDCPMFLSSEDTNLPLGKYKYDIQVNSADGRVDTVVGPNTLKIIGGVTY